MAQQQQQQQQQEPSDAYNLRPHQEPVSIHTVLRGLQVSDGHPNGLGGLIIAAPNFGKTVSMTDVMLKQQKHTLVACPASLVEQNAKNFRRFSNGKLDVTVFDTANSWRGWSRSSNSVLVASNSNQTMSKLLHHRFDRIMYGELSACLFTD